MTPSPYAAIFATFFLAAVPTLAATINLTTLADSVNVGQNDTAGGTTAPAAPGIFTSTGATGFVRGRATGAQEELRTQWYFRFDTAPLVGLNPAEIVSVTLTIPQVGRLNNTLTNNVPLVVFDVGSGWDDHGGSYPVWNQGREATIGTGSEIGRYADVYDATIGFSTATDSDAAAEGTYTFAQAELQTYVSGWLGGDANDGFLLTSPGGNNMGLSFGTPTLTVVTVPEPGIPLLGSLGVLCMLRRRRLNRQKHPARQVP
jgi:hypothetical protein